MTNNKRKIALAVFAAAAALRWVSVAHAQRIPSQIAELQAATVAVADPKIHLLKEFRPIGGVGNNLVNPSFDAVPGSPELASGPLNFAPGSGNPLISGPNPRTISNAISSGTDSRGDNGETNDSVASDWLYVFGQFVDHDLDLEQTLPSNADISILVPNGDPVFPDGSMIALTRATRNPTTSTIINTVAGYLDLSQLYGSTVEVANSLRNPDGTLVSTDGGQALPVVDDMFVSGDVRVMENPELTVVTTLFLREHNYWVSVLKQQHPKWNGDQLYNMARAITTAEYQNIIFTEYLPLLIGPMLGPYHGYDPAVNAQVTQEFSTAAFRVGHSQVSDTQEGLDSNGNVVFTESLEQAFFNTASIDEANGLDALLRSLGHGYAQATDPFAVPVLRNLLGASPDRMDLIAIDIQRERDVGIGTLNQTRKALGMPVYSSFAQLTPDPVLQGLYQTIYGTIDNVDLFVGGLAEPHVPGAIVGPTFQAIIAEQFDALRTGDRFFWLNQDFDKETAAMISQMTLANIIQRNGATPNLQTNVFIATPLPNQSAPHAPIPGSIDRHGRNGRIFVDDGV
jgi:heme peroxidase